MWSFHHFEKRISNMKHIVLIQSLIARNRHDAATQIVTVNKHTWNALSNHPMDWWINLMLKKSLPYRVTIGKCDGKSEGNGLVIQRFEYGKPYKSVSQ